MIRSASRVAPEKAVFRPALTRSYPAGLSPEREMAKQTYWELLRHPKWQEKRLRIMERAGFRCESCFTNEVTLNVHHKFYRKNAAPWDYADHELLCLCETCHEKEHHWQERLKTALAKLDPYYIEFVVGHVEAIVASDVCQQYLNPDREDNLDPGWENVSFPIDSNMHACGFIAYLASSGDHREQMQRLTSKGEAGFMEVLDPRWCRE